jgi:hypothetical protein
MNKDLRREKCCSGFVRDSIQRQILRSGNPYICIEVTRVMGSTMPLSSAGERAFRERGDTSASFISYIKCRIVCIVRLCFDADKTEFAHSGVQRVAWNGWHLC